MCTICFAIGGSKDTTLRYRQSIAPADRDHYNYYSIAIAILYTSTMFRVEQYIRPVQGYSLSFPVRGWDVCHSLGRLRSERLSRKATRLEPCFNSFSYGICLIQLPRLGAHELRRFSLARWGLTNLSRLLEKFELQRKL